MGLTLGGSLKMNMFEVDVGETMWVVAVDSEEALRLVRVQMLEDGMDESDVNEYMAEASVDLLDDNKVPVTFELSSGKSVELSVSEWLEILPTRVGFVFARNSF
jgi:hypothetical protein